MLEEREQSGLGVGDGVLDGVEVGLNLLQQMRERATMLGRERQEERQRLLLEGAAAGGGLGEMVDQFARMRLVAKTQVSQLLCQFEFAARSHVAFQSRS